jgi:hypothetical protein
VFAGFSRQGSLAVSSPLTAGAVLRRARFDGTGFAEEVRVLIVERLSARVAGKRMLAALHGNLDSGSGGQHDHG